MFLKNIHKSEGNYLCCYQKRSYTESVEWSLMSEIQCSGRFRDWAEQSKILDNILIGNQLSNQQTGYHKTVTLKAAFL